MSKRKSICVFCGASTPKDKHFIEVAREVGEWIGKNKCRLVYGGGGTGLMGEVARSVMKYHHDILGITTKAIAKFEEPIPNLPTLIVNTIQERKQKMIQESDVFIVLTGGIGTIDEVSDVMVDQQIGASKKRLIFVNVKGYFNPFMAYLANMEEAGLISPTTRSRLNYRLVDSPEQAFEEMKKESVC